MASPGRQKTYKCPADKFVGPHTRGREDGSAAFRNAFSGYPSTNDPSSFGRYKVFQKTTDIKTKSASGIFVLLDEHPDSINDGWYIVVGRDWGGAYAWTDLPSTLHNGACGFAFLDGHSEIKKWLGKMRSPTWTSVTYTDRHAGVLKADTEVDKRDIDWAKSRMAEEMVEFQVDWVLHFGKNLQSFSDRRASSLHANCKTAEHGATPNEFGKRRRIGSHWRHESERSETARQRLRRLRVFHEVSRGGRGEGLRGSHQIGDHARPVTRR